MAKFTLNDPYVEINAVDVSAYFKSGEFNLTRAQLDAAAGGDDTELKKLGLRQIACRLTLFQDFADNQLDEQMFTLWDAEGTFNVKLRQSKTNAKSPNNPSYEFAAVLPGYNPLSGQHGAMIMTDLTLAAAGKVTRLVA